MSRERVAGLTLMLAACVHQASAQDTYVSASLTGDIVRFSASESVGVVDVTDGGEALGFALRVGTRLGPAWGVEAELARAGEIEHDAATGRFPVPLDRISIAAPFPEPLIFPPIAYRVRTSYRNTMFSAAVWARQDFSVRVALVYTGGVGFHRSQREVEITVDRVGSVPGLPGAPELAILLPSPSVTKTTVYSARPFAGIEARVGMSDRLELVPGIRLHALEGGVLLRPSIGLGWVF